MNKLIFLSCFIFTLVGADNIIFLENGKITGKGTHQELLSFHEGYRVMYQNQLLGG